MELPEFQKELEVLIGRPTDLRPFVCDGSPLTCSVFLVGYNPATEMAADWWNFWEPGYGYRRDRWNVEYKRERKSKPLKPGKKRRTSVSSTRRVIDLIVDAASPTRCLETNIYSVPSETAASLPEKHRATAPFDYLLRVIRPTVVVPYGDDAIEHLAGTNLQWGNEGRVSVKGLDVLVVAEAHFGRPRGGQGWSDERAVRLGQRIRKLAGA